VNYTPEVVDAVLAHMNGDHCDDSLRIVQAFGLPEATAAVMSGLDEEAGLWVATIDGADEEIRIPWPAAPIADRAEIRREVVALHDQACAALGVAPPSH
jgi:hypothetical protein